MIDHVAFVGFFFLTVLLLSVLYYAMTVVPPVRTLGRQVKEQPQRAGPMEVGYDPQFAPLLGWRVMPVDWNPEKKLYDMSGNLL